MKEFNVPAGNRVLIDSKIGKFPHMLKLPAILSFDSVGTKVLVVGKTSSTLFAYWIPQDNTTKSNIAPGIVFKR